MANINIDSVLDKVYEWEHSSRGQKKMDQVISGYVHRNKERTEAGGEILTKKKMAEAGNLLVKTIKKAASSCNLPYSVAKHFDSLSRSRPIKQSDGSYKIELVFTDDLSRESLQPEDYGGVTNIVAIFNNGYPENRSKEEAISHITGWWHDKNVNALPYRQGLYFMQDAVNDFNENYAIPRGMYAEVGAIYDSE